MKRFILTLVLALVFGGGEINEICANSVIENSPAISQNNSRYIKKHRVEDDGLYGMN